MAEDMEVEPTNDADRAEAAYASLAARLDVANQAFDMQTARADALRAKLEQAHRCF